MRKNLKKLIAESSDKVLSIPYISEDGAEALADLLISEGVLVPPVKVEQTVYAITPNMRTGERYVFEYDVTEIIYCSNRGVRPWIITVFGGRKFDNCDFGKTVFLTREEAEQALERSKECHQ